jgi:hypothetical protein
MTNLEICANLLAAGCTFDRIITSVRSNGDNTLTLKESVIWQTRDEKSALDKLFE